MTRLWSDLVGNWFRSLNLFEFLFSILPCVPVLSETSAFTAIGHVYAQAKRFSSVSLGVILLLALCC